MEEIYKTVPSFSDYKVSNKGNVISYRCKNKPKKVTPYIDESGYYRLSVYVGKKLFKRRVHSLMAESFLGFKYVSHKSGVINHIDGNKLNNDLTNLEIISSRKNTTHSILENKGYIGTYDVERNKYISYFRLRGEKIFIGRFDSKEQVTEVYNYCLKISKECSTAKELKNKIKEKFKIVTAKTGRKGKTNFSGVSFQKNRTSPWRAEIRMNNKNISLGNYPTKEQAIEIKKIADDNINLFNEAQQFRELCKNIYKNKN